MFCRISDFWRFMKSFILLLLVFNNLQLFAAENEDYQNFVRHSYPVYIYCSSPLDKGYEKLYEIVFRVHNTKRIILYSRVNYAVGSYKYLDGNSLKDVYFNTLNSDMDIIDPNEHLRYYNINQKKENEMELNFYFNHELPLKMSLEKEPLRTDKRVKATLLLRKEHPIYLKLSERETGTEITSFTCSPSPNKNMPFSKQFRVFISDFL